MRRYYFIVIMLLSGCSATPIIYNPDNLNTAQLITVTTLQEKSFFGSGYSAWIEYIWNEKNEEVTKRNAFLDGAYSKVTLREGKYKFKVECTNGRGGAHPEAIFNLVSGKNYQIYCDIGQGKNFFGMSVDAYAKISIKEI